MSSNPSSPVETPTTPTTPSPVFLPFPFSFLPSRPTLITSPITLRRGASRRTSTHSHSANSGFCRRNSSVSVSPLDLPSPSDTCLVQIPIELPRSKTRRGMIADRDGDVDAEMHDVSPPPLPQAPAPATLQSAHLSNIIIHLSAPLIPLISVTTGLPHPAFPRSILQYSLLTHSQLDDLARHYHQTIPPSVHSWRYPCPVPGWVGPDPGQEAARADVDLTTKRRRWGRFIGLRGCESPTMENTNEDDGGVVERMEREWNAMRRRRADEDRSIEKGGWRGRW